MFPQVTDEEPGAPHRPSRSATAEIRPAPGANRSKALTVLHTRLSSFLEMRTFSGVVIELGSRGTFILHEEKTRNGISSTLSKRTGSGCCVPGSALRAPWHPFPLRWATGEPPRTRSEPHRHITDTILH